MKKVAGEEAADMIIAYIGRLALDPDYKEEQKAGMDAYYDEKSSADESDEA